MQTYREQGGKAYLEGVSLLNNPFNCRTKAWDAWREGWTMESDYWKGQHGDKASKQERS